MKYGWSIWTGFTSHSCEYSIETSGSGKDKKFLEYLSNY
jgi:aryl-phospho-beta-D-glucosidase BglC (GH1 family)